MASLEAAVFLLLGVFFVNAQVIPYKVCLDSSTWNNDACQQIARDGEIKCQTVASKVDCILDVDNGEATISVLKPEEALLGGALVTGQAVVIGEIISDNSPYQTAVLVKSNYIGGFEELKGLKYCHPGYDHDELVTKYVLEELDRKVLKLSCNANQTLTEQKFEALSSAFGTSCRPGKWTEDEALDAKLRSDYSSLCQLCGSDGCNTRYSEPFKDTLSCLTDGGGDVALTALTYAEEFFQVGTNAQNFKYLCENGTTASWNNSCVWTRQLNRLIISSSNSASIMKNFINEKLPSYVITPTESAASSTVMQQSLALLLNLARSDRINLTNPTPLSNYVTARRLIPKVNESVQCNRKLTWSVTTNLEYNKCQWLQQAGVNVGLQPVIDCVYGANNDTLSNFDNIKAGVADITFADANFGYIARRKDLTNIAYLETDTRQLSRIVVLVKNNATWYSGISSLAGKSICLPEYGGKEWLAYIDWLRKANVLPNSCDYGKIFSEFVGESCAPGAQSQLIDIDNTDQEKLCAKCIPIDDSVATAKYCNADEKNKYYDSYGALKCLEDDSGDYAVIALNDLPRDYINQIAAHQYYTVISKNGSLASYSGFQVDENAPITIITAGEVVVKNNNTNSRDLVLLLRDIEVQFGQNLQKAFKVFERFNHTFNLLFPDSTPGLTFTGTNRYIDNFKRLLSDSETCDGSVGSSSHVFQPAFISLVILAFLARIM